MIFSTPINFLLATFVLLGLAMPAAAQLGVRYDQGWIQVAWKGKALTKSLPQPSVSITVDDQRLPTSAKPSDSEESRVLYQLPCGTLRDSTETFTGFPNCIVRRLVFENGKDAQRDLTGADFRVAILADEGAPRWQAQSFVMVECAPRGPTLCIAFTSDEDPWRCELAPAPSFLASHHCGVTWRLPAGRRATIGSQYIWVVDGGLAAARASAQRWYDAVGLTIADGGPDWISDCIIYQASAGGSVDSRFSDCGGFDNFARQLDYIADLGCNAFWLMSVLTHKDPKNPKAGWNLYDPAEYEEVDPAYGGEEGLTRLVEAMRARDFRIINEIVPSGGHAQLCTSHPEWWTYRRDGERSKGFGQALDYSSPGWQAQIRKTIRWLTARWGFDGYRVDVADGYGINWRSATNGPHVSLSTRAGSIGMLRAIREGSLEGGAQAPAVIPETIDNRPEYARYGQVGYGFRFIFFLEEERAAARKPAVLRDLLRDFFERDRGSLPRGMVSLRAINNHDTIVSHGRADRRFGVGLQRALTGVCTIVEGVPMIYQEQEVGSYHYFRRLFWARRRVPEIRRGRADYLGVKGPPEVFAVLRSIEDSHAIGLVNLSSEPIDAEIQLPDNVIPTEGATLYDAVTGQTARADSSRFRWRLEPYETAIPRVGRPPEGKAPPERHQPQSVSATAATGRLPIATLDALLTWQPSPAGGKFKAAGLEGTITAKGLVFDWTVKEEGTVQVRASASLPGEGELSIEIVGVDLWLAATVTGIYEDRLLRRHYPWPKGLYHWDPSIIWGYEPNNLYRYTMPSGRQWQSAVAPLLPKEGWIGFAGPSRDGIALFSVVTNAMNVVLTDRSEWPNPEPYGLTLRFLANDKAPNPRWTPGYRQSFWTEIPTEIFSRHDEPLKVSFTLAPLKEFGAVIASSQPSALSNAAEETIGPSRYTRFGERLWLIEPNTVTWTNLPLTHHGSYTLWMQLRHSERGPKETELGEHYRIALDGKPLSFEWTRLNAWHTGNGYFGWARAEAGSLKAGGHSLTIKTSHSWCALLPRMYISREPSFAR